MAVRASPTIVRRCRAPPMLVMSGRLVPPVLPAAQHALLSSRDLALPAAVAPIAVALTAPLREEESRDRSATRSPGCRFRTAAAPPASPRIPARTRKQGRHPRDGQETRFSPWLSGKGSRGGTNPPDLWMRLRWLAAIDQAIAGSIQWLCSFRRLWTAACNRHSERTADLPRRWKRRNPRLNLFCANTGSTVALRCL